MLHVQAMKIKKFKLKRHAPKQTGPFAPTHEGFLQSGLIVEFLQISNVVRWTLNKHAMVSYERRNMQRKYVQ